MQTLDTAQDIRSDGGDNDLGPLAWVIEEIRKSLDGAVKSLRRFTREAEMALGDEVATLDVAPLRLARQQLHQAAGALEMVGIKPASAMLQAMENAVAAFVQKPEQCSDDAVAKIERASFALSEFLDSLLAGKTVASVGLFPQHRDVLALTGAARVHPADLWMQPWRWLDARIGLPPQGLTPSPTVRGLLDQAVLRVVKTADRAASRDLCGVCLGLAAGAPRSKTGAYWKIAAAFFEAVAHGLVPQDVYAKRMASRVLLQYSTLAKGDPSIDERLAQDLLFYCAQSAPPRPADTPVLSAVREAYGLTDETSVDYEVARYGRFDPAALAQARKRIAAAAETWSGLAGGEISKLKPAADQFSLVTESMIKLQPESRELARALTQALETTSRSGQAPGASLAMEVATSVLYLQAIYEDLDPSDPQQAARANRLAERLDRVRAGGESEPLEPWIEELYRRVSDRQTMGSVVEELRGTLGGVEKSLDQYFRNPADRSPLGGVSAQLSQMRGVLSVLGLDQASTAVIRMRDNVDRFVAGEGGDEATRTRVFERLGNSLGALGFLVDMLGYQRALAKKLFVYDEAADELKILMGREAPPVAPLPLVSEGPVPEDAARQAPLSAPVAVNLPPPKPAEPVLASPTPAAVQTPAAPTGAQAQAPQTSAPVTIPTLPMGSVVVAAAMAASAPQASEARIEDDELRDVFLEEAREVIASGLASIAQLRQQSNDLNEQTALRRAFHTLKGSSRMVGLNAFGEAAWAMEQLHNAVLAEQKPAGRPLLDLSDATLKAFSAWVEDLALSQGSHWSAAPFRHSADAMRLRGEFLALEIGKAPPVPEVLPAPAPEPAEPETSALGPETGVGLNQPLMEAAPGHAEPALQVTPVPEAPAEPVPDPLVGMSSNFVDLPSFDTALGALEMPAEPMLEDLDFSNPSAPPAASDLVEAVPDSPVINTGSPAVAAAPEVEPFAFELPEEHADAVVAAPDVAGVSASGLAPMGVESIEAIELPLDAFPSAEGPDQAALPVLSDGIAADSIAAAAPQVETLPAADVSAIAAGDTEDHVKVIGDLRISIPLYNVYLNEADEWSRRLQVETSEWALELHRPLPDSIVAMAHSLAGSSATVGFSALSELARLLEQSLLHAQFVVPGRAAHAQAFVDAADDVRRLLHQFAAGFLKLPEPAVLDGLRAVLADDVSTSVSPVPDEQDLAAIDDVQAAPDVLDPAVLEPAATSAVVAPEVLPLPEPAELLAPEAVTLLPDAIQSPGIASEAFPLAAGAGLAEPARLLASGRAAAGQSLAEDIDEVDSIDPELFPIFEEEAIDLLPRLSAAMRQWAERPERESARFDVLRALHTLKGSARLAGAMRLGELAHRMESQIEHLPASADLPSTELDSLLANLDDLQSGLDALRGADAAAQAAQPELAPAATSAAVGVPDAGSAAAAQSGRLVAAPSHVLAPLKQTSTHSVRVRSQVLDRLLGQAGEVLISRSRLESRVGQMRGSINELGGNLDRLRQQLRDLEVQAESQMQSRMSLSKEHTSSFDPLEFDRFTRVQELTRIMAESMNDLGMVQRTLQRLTQSAEDDLISQGRQARELQRDLLRTRMVEFEAISERLYGAVRQAAKDAGKQVRLDIEGGGIEMDRGVLERMTPPFEHLLRNSVAHGIELPGEREAHGKPAQGTINVRLHTQGNDVVIDFSDDGAGLNLERIRAKAIAQGLLAADASLSPEEAAQLIFRPGFSTAAEVSELAGRGIGMDVVRSEITAMGGRIETSTTPGKGTRFTLVLPLTTAVTQVVMLRVGKFSVGVPASLVEMVRRVSPADITQYETEGQVVYGGESVPYFWAGALLQESPRSEETAGRTRTLVVMRSAAQRVAIHVDEVLGNQEVVVKHLGPQLSRLPGLAGMSVLASGLVVLIYNPVALAQVYGDRARALASGASRHLMGESLAAAMGGAPDVSEDASLQAGVAAAQAAQFSGGRASAVAAAQLAPLVLVVDDSITVRRVTQRLLQRGGFRVTTANDGLHALERLQEEVPQVILSDIEMPRMDGFDLARNIRKDERLKDVPIIMITSRIAAKHRDHAMELGVNHYLGKPYAEDELMALVRRYTQPEGAIMAE